MVSDALELGRIDEYAPPAKRGGGAPSSLIAKLGHVVDEPAIGATFGIANPTWQRQTNEVVSYYGCEQGIPSAVARWCRWSYDKSDAQGRLSAGERVVEPEHGAVGPLGAMGLELLGNSRPYICRRRRSSRQNGDARTSSGHEPISGRNGRISAMRLDRRDVRLSNAGAICEGALRQPVPRAGKPNQIASCPVHEPP